MASHELPKPITDDWHTPPEVIAAFPEFDFDPCCSHVQTTRTARRRIHWPENGLTARWEGTVWLNPPYGAGTIDAWLEKLASHGDGMALIPARVDVGWFHRFVFGRAAGIFFFRGRLRFIDPAKGRGASAAYPSVLASYGERCDGWLRDCKLPGVYLPTADTPAPLPLFG